MTDTHHFRPASDTTWNLQDRHWEIPICACGYAVDASGEYNVLDPLVQLTLFVTHLTDAFNQLNEHFDGHFHSPDDES